MNRNQIEQEDAYNVELLKNTFNSLNSIELNGADIDIKDILAPGKENQNLFRNKPDDFRYEISERSNSLIPKSIQKDIVELANIKLRGEKEKIHPNASNSYDYEKQMEEISPRLEKFIDNVENLNKTIPFLNDSKLSFKMADELKNGASGKVELNKPIRMSTFKSLSLTAEREIQERELLNDIGLEVSEALSNVEEKEGKSLKNNIGKKLK
jgi:hypothetical protein